MQLPSTALDAHLLHAVCRVAQSRRVDEAKQHPAQHKGVFHHIAGRTVHVANDGAIVLKQRIEQGRFAGIGCADNGHRPSFAQRIASRKRVGQSGGLALHGGRYGIELTAIGKFQVFVVGKVQFQLEQRGELQQLLAQSGQSLTEMSAHLTHRHAMRRRRRGSNEVGHSLRLRQVHFAVQKRPTCEFTRFGRLGPRCQEQLHHALQNVSRPVARNFGGLFAGVRMGGAKHGNQDFVDNGLIGGIHKVAERQGVRTPFGQRATTACTKHAISHGEGIGTGHTHHAEGTAGRCRHGTNGGGLHEDYYYKYER